MNKLILIVLKIIGFILIIIGFVAAYYGPLEIYVFYLFSEGGRFHYDGFGMGSIWFGVLVLQNLAYYVVAALCVPVGIGLLKLRRWTLTLINLFSWFWLGVGILLIVNLVTLIPQTFHINIPRDILIIRLSSIGIFAIITLIILPTIALGFFRCKKVRSIFEEYDPKTYWTENYPFSLLALLLLFVFMIFVMNLSIFFQGVFPVFGKFFLGRQSVYLVSLCILVLGILIVGIILLKSWAWWDSLIYLSLMSISSLISFPKHNFSDILLMLNLPSFEKGIFDRLTLLHDFHFTGLVLSPLLVALCLLIYSKRYFGKIESEKNGQ